MDFTVPALLLGFVVGGSALAAGVITAFAKTPQLRALRSWRHLVVAAP